MSMRRRPAQDMRKLKCIGWSCEVKSKDLLCLRNLWEALPILSLMLCDTDLINF